MSQKLVSQGITFTAINTEDPTRRVQRLYSNLKDGVDDASLARLGRLLDSFTPGDVTDTIRLRPVL